MPRKILPRRLLCAALLAALGPIPAIAGLLDASAPRPASCPVIPALSQPVSSLRVEDTRDGNVHATADRVESRLNETTLFTGNVELRYQQLHLFGDSVTFNQADNTLSAQGNIFLSQERGDAIHTPVLRYDIDTERGQAEQGEFMLGGGTSRGRAGRMFLEGRDSLTLESVRYTTCPPGRDDWFLRAGKLKLDKVSEAGTAYHTVIEFMKVPIFYSPYMSFPLSDARKTGFLAPQFGHSSRSGFMLSVPYYFNIAPNFDDTLTTRLLTDRGAQLLNEFRYLGQNYAGRLDLAFLPNDRKTDTDRQGLFYVHNHSLSPSWSMATNIQWVSDPNYFVDLSTGATEAARTHQPNYLRFDYSGSLWRFSSLVYTYQTLDATIPVTSQPYQRLPQLVLVGDSDGGANRLHYRLESEWVNFYRQASVTGQRLDLRPSVSLPLRTPYFYFTPKATARYTSYRLDNVASGSSPERSVPTYSLDTGLEFERHGLWRGQGFLQTLEPRLFYVYTPYRNQDSLPVFDSAVPDFSFYDFFRENRFVGGDRVGDANHLTAAVSSRFLAPDTGIETARISFGQVRYYENQQVNLPAGTVVQTSSDLIGELYARIGQPWHARSSLQWDNRQSETRKASLYFNYHPAPDRIVNAGYRYINAPPNPEQQLFDISTQWPFHPRWTGLARWSYSVVDSTTVHATVGLQYTSCCWSLRVTGRHRILPDGNLDNAVLFEFELSGLAKLGTSDENPLNLGRFIFQ